MPLLIKWRQWKLTMKCWTTTEEKNITFDTNLKVDAFQQALMDLPDHPGLDTVRRKKPREPKSNPFTNTMIEKTIKIPDN